MKPPPIPLTPSGLSEKAQEQLGKPLVVRCSHGWGWEHCVQGRSIPLVVEALAMGHLRVLPEGFVQFTTPRSGVYGAVLSAPDGYALERFVAFTMCDGCDYDFTEHIAPAWRVILGDGKLDYESSWFPILDGKDVYFGYGTLGLNEQYIDLDLKQRKDEYEASLK
jgi:hypothetical protein